MSDLDPIDRWRLVLGQASEAVLGRGEGEVSAMDAALSWLYDRDPSMAERDLHTREGGPGPSTLTVPEWIHAIHELFPQDTIERLQTDAVERYHIDEVVTDPAILEQAVPSESLLQAVLRTKHLMNEKVLAMARKIIQQVVRELMERLAVEVRTAFTGTLDRRRRSAHKIAANFDLRTTLRTNLKHYDPARRRLVLERAVFSSRARRHSEKWQIIILVDQSGSMLPSTIHASVTAACLHGLPQIRTHLCVFDTEVVDLTHHVTDPVETLMKVQLGGGTDIARAVSYGASLVASPRRAIMVLLTDLYEGGDARWLIQQVRDLCSQGTKVLVLAALDDNAAPDYDRQLGQTLADLGAFVGAMTPAHLAQFVADCLR